VSPVRQPAVFLDRDGTITQDRGFTFRPDDFQLLDNALEGLQLLAKLGFALVVATNQSGIARGYFTEADADRFNRLLADTLAANGVILTAIRICPYHPTEGIGIYRCESSLRKPGAGMLLAAANEHQLDLPNSFMIGDKLSDVLAGQQAGCRTILVRTGAGGTGEPDLRAKPDWIAADMLQAARIIAGQTGPRDPREG
jgi:D-glycero-D-manno-heptose 1,7-bisphosphate phosphatase